MSQLLGMKAICGYIRRSESTALELIRNYGMPAWKAKGIWESDTEAIDEWRRDRLKSPHENTDKNGKPSADRPRKKERGQGAAKKTAITNE